MFSSISIKSEKIQSLCDSQAMKENRLAVSHYCYDKGAGTPLQYNVASRCLGGNQSVRYKRGRVGRSSKKVISKCTKSTSLICVYVPVR